MSSNTDVVHFAKMQLYSHLHNYSGKQVQATRVEVSPHNPVERACQETAQAAEQGSKPICSNTGLALHAGASCRTAGWGSSCSATPTCNAALCWYLNSLTLRVYLSGPIYTVSRSLLALTYTKVWLQATQAMPAMHASQHRKAVCLTYWICLLQPTEENINVGQMSQELTICHLCLWPTTV